MYDLTNKLLNATVKLDMMVVLQNICFSCILTNNDEKKKKKHYR